MSQFLSRSCCQQGDVPSISTQFPPTLVAHGQVMGIGDAAIIIEMDHQKRSQQPAAKSAGPSVYIPFRLRMATLGIAADNGPQRER